MREIRKTGLSEYLFLALALLSLFLFGCAESSSNDQSQAGGAVVAEEQTGSVMTFVLTGENFKFFMDGQQNPDLKVKLGDKVRIEFTSTQGFHDVVIDEFNAATERVRAVNASIVEFTADKKGTFEYYCSVGSHRVSGMKGKLIVE